MGECKTAVCDSNINNMKMIRLMTLTMSNLVCRNITIMMLFGEK